MPATIRPSVIKTNETIINGTPIVDNKSLVLGLFLMLRLRRKIINKNIGKT
jgi:cellobiose-specific phosphotransferase system component IIC